MIIIESCDINSWLRSDWSMEQHWLNCFKINLLNTEIAWLGEYNVAKHRVMWKHSWQHSQDQERQEHTNTKNYFKPSYP